jgi:hypothetical protein
MWDGVDCTLDWVTRQIPEVIREIYDATNENDLEEKLQKRINENDIDFATISLSYVNIKAACILNIGFKFAGTANQMARDLILG